MSFLTRNPWLKHLTVVLVTVVTLGTMTLRSTPADARVFVGVGIPFPGVGYYAPAPYYGYGYYGYPAELRPPGPSRAASFSAQRWGRAPRSSNNGFAFAPCYFTNLPTLSLVTRSQGRRHLDI